MKTGLNYVDKEFGDKQKASTDLVPLLLLYKLLGLEVLNVNLRLIGVEWRLKNMLCFFGSVIKIYIYIKK